jgi:hypothetical protein
MNSLCRCLLSPPSPHSTFISISHTHATRLPVSRIFHSSLSTTSWFYLSSICRVDTVTPHQLHSSPSPLPSHGGTRLVNTSQKNSFYVYENQHQLSRKYSTLPNTPPKSPPSLGSTTEGHKRWRKGDQNRSFFRKYRLHLLSALSASFISLSALLYHYSEFTLPELLEQPIRSARAVLTVCAHCITHALCAVVLIDCAYE